MLSMNLLTHDMGIPFYIRKTDVLRDQLISRKFKDEDEEQTLATNRTTMEPSTFLTKLKLDQNNSRQRP